MRPCWERCARGTTAASSMNASSPNCCTGRLGQCSGMTLSGTLGGMQEVNPWEVWREFVFRGLRSRIGVALLLLGLSVTAWQFSIGHTLAGSLVLAVLAFNYACVGAAVGARPVVRGGRRGA